MAGGALDPRFLDHFQNPRNVGDLPSADVRVHVENPVCGDTLDLAIALEGDRVKAAKYRVLGCSGAIASASVATDRIVGQSLAEARALDARAIDAALGGLPQLKKHGADLAAEAIAAAVRKLGERPK
jgi:nitrogen fixation NifU-like protein